jgi:hypothetical protein
MVINHSQTYRYNNLFNIPHIVRLMKIKSIVRKFTFNKSFNKYIDVGCSNGYLTNLLSKDKFAIVFT